MCRISSTRQRVYLPCATRKTHGKHNTHNNNPFCRVQVRNTHGSDFLPWDGSHHTAKNPTIYFKLNPLPYPLLPYPLHRPLLSFSPSAATPSPHRRGAWPAPPACCPSPPPFARPSLAIVGSGGGARGGGSGGTGGGERQRRRRGSGGSGRARGAAAERGAVAAASAKARSSGGGRRPARGAAAATGRGERRPSEE